MEVEFKVKIATKIILTKQDDDSNIEWGFRNFIEELVEDTEVVSYIYLVVISIEKIPFNIYRTFSVIIEP